MLLGLLDAVVRRHAAADATSYNQDPVSMERLNEVLGRGATRRRAGPPDSDTRSGPENWTLQRKGGTSVGCGRFGKKMGVDAGGCGGSERRWGWIGSSLA